MFLRKTKVRIISAVLVFIHVFVICNFNVFGAQYENLSDLGLSSKCAILMDADTGTIIYESNSHEALPPASVTKVMTLLLIYEAVAEGKIKWEDMVTVSEHAASMGGSQVFLEPFEQQTAKELTKCIAIASANDAAVTMAEYIAGSEPAFVELMNKRAKELDMKETNFVNACGLDAEGHVTSASDIAVMSRALTTKYPEVFEYTKTWQDTIIHKTKRGETEFGLTNTNKLLKWYDGATGLKTGSTGKALYCLSGTAEKNGLKLIGVVMAAPDFKTRFQEVMKLFDYGFANYETTEVAKSGESIGDVLVYKGMEESANVVVQEKVQILTQKGADETIEKEVDIIPSINAPFAEGTKVGEVIYKIGGKEVGRAEAITQTAVEKVDVSTMMKRLLEKWC